MVEDGCFDDIAAAEVPPPIETGITVDGVPWGWLRLRPAVWWEFEVGRRCGQPIEMSSPGDLMPVSRVGSSLAIEASER